MFKDVVESDFAVKRWAMGLSTKVDVDSDKVCPFVSEPYDECFVNNMVSQNIEEVLQYCGGHFEDCRIYLKHIKEEQTGNS